MSCHKCIARLSRILRTCRSALTRLVLFCYLHSICGQTWVYLNSDTGLPCRERHLAAPLFFLFILVFGFICFFTSAMVL
jgi:hypothetical protein